jgi:hypothetical protein
MSDLHGNVPDRSPAALLVIDVVNDLEWPGGEAIFPDAMEMARRIATLKARATSYGVPTIYLNDNFGRWKSDFRAQVKHCLHEDVRGRPLSRRSNRLRSGAVARDYNCDRRIVPPARARHLDCGRTAEELFRGRGDHRSVGADRAAVSFLRWQLIINTGTTIVTFLMVFLIQNTQNRDSKVLHLKLDELLRASHAARNTLLDLENMSEDELAELGNEFRRLREMACADESARKQGVNDRSVTPRLRRRIHPCE